MNTLHEAPRFSWLFEPRDRGLCRPWDCVLWETPNFAVLPSLGSLVPGWLLVVPKRPMPNLIGLCDNEYDELEALVSLTSKKLRVFPGRAHMFEHGGRSGSSLSCGVDQAHLHVVPLEFDIIELAQSDNSILWSSVSSLDAVRTQISPDSEYLYVSAFGEALLGSPRQPTSQWFRRLIANQMGVPEEWNYREFPKLDVVRETKSRLAA